MRRPSILLKTLRELRWQTFWYGLGLGLMGAFVIYVYPSYKEQIADFEIPEALQALIGDVDYGTGPGFVSAEFFSWVPIILVVFAIMSGTAALAGEEANGTLDLLLAQPISRVRLVVEKLAGLLIATAAICGIVYLGWLISVPFVEIDLGYGELAVATLNMLPLTLAFQAFAMWAGAALPRRGVATGLVTAMAIVSFFVNYLASLVDVLEPLQWFSVFYHYHGAEALNDGFDWAGLAILVGLYLAFAALTLAFFQRRDLGVNAPLRLVFWRPASA